MSSPTRLCNDSQRTFFSRIIQYAPVGREQITMTSITDDTEVTEAIASLSLKAQEEQEEHQLEEEHLSTDLATFLSNPSLKAALADGSLKLDQYSVTVEQELHELES